MFIVAPIISIALATCIGLLISPFLKAQLATSMALITNLGLTALLSLLFNASLKKMLGGKRSRQQRNARPIAGPRRHGSIKWFNTKKQYGFITSEDGDDIFVHKRFINGDKRQRIREGMNVEFSVSETDKGLQAEDVNLID